MTGQSALIVCHCELEGLSLGVGGGKRESRQGPIILTQGSWWGHPLLVPGPIQSPLPLPSLPLRSWSPTTFLHLEQEVSLSE